jgi:hypothetical protein
VIARLLSEIAADAPAATASTDHGAAGFPSAAPDQTWVTEIGYPEPDRGPLQALRSPKAVAA